MSGRVLQMRLVVEASDDDEAVRFTAAPTRTPWRSLNSRLAAPAGLQITLFQELETS